MRTLGLLGGMSWESTAIYYRLLNEAVRDRLGGLHSARILLASVDFADIEPLQRADRWDEAGAVLAEAGRRLEAAGADAVVICSNTMHKVAGAVAAAVRVPLIDIIAATAAALRARQVSRPLLLATRYTMEQPFYVGRMREEFGIVPIVPSAADREILQRIIFEELCRGIVRPESKARCLAMVGQAEREGCNGVIFGCTEIGMLLSQDDLRLPAFDTTLIHAAAATDFALAA